MLTNRISFRSASLEYLFALLVPWRGISMVLYPQQMPDAVAKSVGDWFIVLMGVCFLLGSAVTLIGLLSGRRTPIIAGLGLIMVGFVGSGLTSPHVITAGRIVTNFAYVAFIAIRIGDLAKGANYVK